MFHLFYFSIQKRNSPLDLSLGEFRFSCVIVAFGGECTVNRVNYIS
jgi:hypothetical protein